MRHRPARLHRATAGVETPACPAATLGWSRCGSTARAADIACVPEPLAGIDDWLEPYRGMWESSLDALGVHLDEMPEHDAR